MNARLARNLKVFSAVLLICVTAFSLFKYIVTLKEKYALFNNLNEAKEEIVALEKATEKERQLQQGLAQENLTLKEELKAVTAKLVQLEAELQSARENIEGLTSEIVLAKAENSAIRQEKDNLALELDQVSREKDVLQSRLSSIPELKKRIREVKAQIRTAKAMTREIARKRRVIEGNRGYLIKNGKSTYPAVKIKIEVMPASSSK